MESWFYYVFLFMVGTVVGSFLNVCIVRIPEGKSVISPPSSCPKCGQRIRFYDNIPIISFLVLRGKCRDCGERISPVYPLVEFTTGIAFVGIYLSNGFSLDFIRNGFLISVLIAISVIDLKYYIIPNKIVYPGLTIGLVLSTIKGLNQLRDSILGMGIGVGALILISLLGRVIFRKESMGMGDVKLAGLIGLFLGWKGVLLSLYAASIVGAIFGIGLMVFAGRKRDSMIPFGPFIAVGSVVVMFWGRISILGLP